MRLDHLDLHVPDVAATRAFLVEYFGLVASETRGADGLAILHDDAGLEVVISRPIVKFGGADAVSVDKATYHIGFTLASRAEVDRLHERLTAGGTGTWAPPRLMRGIWLFYCVISGRIVVEVRTREASG